METKVDKRSRLEFADAVIASCALAANVQTH